MKEFVIVVIYLLFVLMILSSIGNTSEQTSEIEIKPILNYDIVNEEIVNPKLFNKQYKIDSDEHGGV